jgi:hypothetical protein
MIITMSITTDRCDCNSGQRLLWIDDSDAEYLYYYECNSCGHKFYSRKRL